MKTLLLREMDVRVERVEPKAAAPERGSDPEARPPPAAASTLYVFALRPLRKRAAKAHHYLNELQGSYARGWWELDDLDGGDLDGGDLDADDLEGGDLEGDGGVPVAHEVARSYSQCRALYTTLRALTDAQDPAACGCALGACPFWSLAGVLRAVAFPRKTLFNCQPPRVLAARQRALSAMMRQLLGALRGCYRARHFREQRPPFPSHGGGGCKVLAALGVFLELDDPAVEDKLRIGERRLHGRLSLEGWLTHRRASILGGSLPPGADGRPVGGRAGGRDAERKTSEAAEPLV